MRLEAHQLMRVMPECVGAVVIALAAILEATDSGAASPQATLP